jgi:uncharacterized protein (TIGR02099 family)
MIIRKLGKILAFSLGGLLLLLLLAMLALKLVLDRAPQYRAEIKEWVHAQTGYHIEFAHVSPAFRWYGPELYFDRLELRSKDDQRVLARAAGGRVAADIWQLIRTGKLLAGRIELETPNISVARLGATRFAIASEIELGGEDSSMATLKLSDLPAGRLVIRHAILTLDSWNEDLPKLILQHVDMDLRRDPRELALAFTAQLPTELGGTLSFEGHARGNGNFQTLAWDALARSRGISFPGWHKFLPEYLATLDSGTGAFDIAAQGVGPALSRADVDFGAADVEIRASEGPVAKFDQMSGAMTLVHTQDRWSLSGQRVRVGRRDRESAFDVTWQDAQAGLLNMRVHANYLRAETLLPLTGFLPQKELRERLRDIAPSGEWTDTSIEVERAAPADPWRLHVAAKFQHAGVASVGGVPGVRGVAGSIAGNESGGQVIIDTADGVFHWPSQLLHHVELERLKANIYWKRTAQELLIASPDWEIRTHDGELRGQLAWHQPSDSSSPALTMVAAIVNGNVGNARNYLPNQLLGAGALSWLDDAFVAGRMRANILFQGPVRSFPFREGGGIFLARCVIDGMTLNYSPGWAPAENMAVAAEFRDQGMSARLISGHIGELKLESGEAHFPDFSSGELRIHANARSEVASALSFLRASPLDAISEHAFSIFDATGALQAGVDLFLPFKDFEHRQVLVHGHLDGASMNRPGESTKATDVTGDFDIDGGQVARADIHGQLLGGGFTMVARSGRNRPLTRTQLDFRGSVTAEAVRAAFDLPPALGLSGQTDWRGVLKIVPEPARERSLRISTTLVGFDMKLPAPLDKSAATPLPSWLEIQWPQVGGPQGSFAIGSLVSTTYSMDSDPSGMRLAHASMSFGGNDDNAADSQILNVGGAVQRLDLGGWLRLSGSGGKDAKPLSYYMRGAKLNVAELDYLGLAFRDVSLDLLVSERSWRINVGGPNVKGVITVPSAEGSTEPWNLQFDRLQFDVADNEEPSAGGSPGNIPADADPHSMPAVNFHAKEFIWGERQFGDVAAALAKQPEGLALKSLSVTAPTFTLNAQGEWRARDSGVSRIKGTLISTDVQGTLKDLGYADVIDAKAGKMEFDLTWLGAPTAAALGQVVGHVQLSMEKGQVTGLKPGAGRVLGFTSIAALPRRLALDFSDLTDKGLAFDTVHGDFELRDGNAYTDNVLLKGPAAEIGLIGRIGLKNKDYDQTAVVTGNVGNSLSIPVASTLVCGPICGAAALLFTQVFKQPLKGLARGYYRITGSWDNPTVERVKSAEAAPVPAEAAK